MVVLARFIPLQSQIIDFYLLQDGGFQCTLCPYFTKIKNTIKSHFIRRHVTETIELEKKLRANFNIQNSLYHI